MRGYWIEEAGTKQASKPTFRLIELNLKKLVCLTYSTDELLQDAGNLGKILTEAFTDEINFMLLDAISNGSGAGQPLGIMNSGCLATVSKETGQASNTVLTENVLNMHSRLFASSRKRAVWLINQNIEPQLQTMSIAVGAGGHGVYTPANGLSVGGFSTLFGLPIIPIEQCQTLGTLGDIILADMSGYALARKPHGIEHAMSIHVQFITDQSVFRAVLRVDGQPILASAVTPFKGGSDYDQSHFIALETRN